MRVDVVPTTKLHCIHLGLSMRQADVAEVCAVGLGPIEAVYTSWRASHFGATILVDGAVAAVAGLVVDGRQGAAWLLTSSLVERAPLAFHRIVRGWLRRVGQHVDVVWNLVDARHDTSLRWLQALGFSVGEALPHGPLSVPFRRVVKEV